MCAFESAVHFPDFFCKIIFFCIFFVFSSVSLRCVLRGSALYSPPPPGSKTPCPRASAAQNTALRALRWVEPPHPPSGFFYDRAAKQSYTFFWDEFCAYYVELVKPVLFGKAGDEALRCPQPTPPRGPHPQPPDDPDGRCATPKVGVCPNASWPRPLVTHTPCG